MVNRQARIHNPKYLSTIRQLPCLRCGSRAGVEAAHIRLHSLEWGQKAGVRTGAGGGEKPSDMWAIPLCSECHRTGSTAEHVVGTIKFYRDWGIDPHAVAFNLFQAFPLTPVMMRVVMNVLYFNAYKKEPSNAV